MSAKLSKSKGWIRTTDKLPADEVLVLEYTPADTEPVWIGYCRAGLWFNPDGVELTHTVTHWRPLPEPPK